MTWTLLRWIAPVVIVLAVVYAIYDRGRTNAEHAAEMTEVKRKLALSQTLAATERQRRENDARLAAEQARRMLELEAAANGLQVYADALEDANNECLSGDDTDKLRDFWR